jgi:hypothetical protein
MAAGVMAGGSSILAGVGAGPAKVKPRGAGMQGSLLLQQQMHMQVNAAAAAAASVGGPAASSGLPSSTGGGAPSPSSKAEESAAAAAARSSGQDQLRGAGLAAAEKEDDVSMSKRAQWESELYEELERHRQEQRATRMSAYAQRT